MSNTVVTKLVIVNKLGMHARPAMLFVETANKFAAKITVRRTDQNETFDGKSIMQLMMLAATCGTELEVTACGNDAEPAIEALTELINARFDEE